MPRSKHRRKGRLRARSERRPVTAPLTGADRASPASCWIGGCIASGRSRPRGAADARGASRTAGAAHMEAYLDRLAILCG